jgi:hypothetical protein
MKKKGSPMTLHHLPIFPVFSTPPSQESYFLLVDDEITRCTVRENELLVSDFFEGDERVLHSTVPEPTLSQQKKGKILDQVEILEQATVALLERRLGRELRERARQEAQELIGSLEPLGLTFEARLTRGIDLIFKRKFPFEEALILQLAEFVVALRENVERKTELL